MLDGDLFFFVGLPIWHLSIWQFEGTHSLKTLPTFWGSEVRSHQLVLNLCDFSACQFTPKLETRLANGDPLRIGILVTCWNRRHRSQVSLIWMFSCSVDWSNLPSASWITTSRIQCIHSFIEWVIRIKDHLYSPPFLHNGCQVLPQRTLFLLSCAHFPYLFKKNNKGMQPAKTPAEKNLQVNGYPTVFNTELAEYGNQSGALTAR